jgi:hypothetical protein
MSPFKGNNAAFSILFRNRKPHNNAGLVTQPIQILKTITVATIRTPTTKLRPTKRGDGSGIVGFFLVLAMHGNARSPTQFLILRFEAAATRGTVRPYHPASRFRKRSGLLTVPLVKIFSAARPRREPENDQIGGWPHTPHTFGQIVEGTIADCALWYAKPSHPSPHAR